jgi:hypothetical protein
MPDASLDAQQHAANSLGQLRDEGLKVHQCTGWLPTCCQLPSIYNLLCDGAVHAAALARKQHRPLFLRASAAHCLCLDALLPVPCG